MDPTPARPHTPARPADTSAAGNTLSTAGSFAGGPTAPDPVIPELAAHPDYEVVRELGRGGMGVVYLARQKLADRLEVLKVMAAALTEKPGAQERFVKEMQAAARLNHPNIAQLYSPLRLGRTIAFAMEFVDGEDLHKLVKNKGALPVQHACYYVQQAAQGLQHAHEKGMTHRDIKPHNLMLHRDGKKHTVKILDFGLAKLSTGGGEHDPGLTREGQMLGTPDYVAPEQIQDAAKADIRADVYSLGCTLYYLLTGRPPFRSDNLYGLLWKHQSEPPPAPSAARPDVPPELDAVLAQMMAKAPADRYQTPADVARALAPFARGQVPAPQPPAAPPSAYPQPVYVEVPTAPVGGYPAPPYPYPPASMTAPEGYVPQPQPPQMWGSVSPFSVDDAPFKPARKPAPKGVNPLVWVGLAGCVALFAVVAVVGLWAAGVFRLKTKDGTLVVENLPPDAEVFVDGDQVTVTRNGDAVTLQVAKDKAHRVRVVRGGKELFADDVKVAVGGEPVRVRVEQRLTKGQERIPTGGKPADPARPDVPAAGPTIGFTQLFNGTDLAGWEPFPGLEAQWTVEDGELVGRGGRGVLFSKRGDYADFHLRVEAKISDRGNGGVFVRQPYSSDYRAGYEAQIEANGVDTYKTGSLYGLVKQATCPHAPDAWFTMDVIVEGNRVRISVNGTATVDYTNPNPRFDKGYIALQQWHPGGWVRFRKVEIKELAPGGAAAPAPPPAAVAAGVFAPLFNGTDLSGWAADGADTWAVNGGEVVNTADGSGARGGFLLSPKDYTNFRARGEVNLGPGAKSGFVFRAVPGNRIRDLPYQMKVQLIADGGPGAVATPTGSLLWANDATTYRAPDKLLSGMPPDEWHRFEFVVVGQSVRGTVDGTEVLNADLDRFLADPRALNAVTRKTGRIGLQSHTGRVRFRRLEVQELKPDGTPVAAAAGPFVPADLSGWAGLPGYWKVDGGALVGTRPAGAAEHTFLCSKLAYRDFDLRFQVKLDGGVGNTGVQIRSRVEDAGKLTVSGPQVDLGAKYWGCLYGEKFGGMMKAAPAGAETAVVPDGFNDVHVTCVGKRVRIRLNGVTTVDDDFPTMWDEGIIAWQFHGGVMAPREVTFRNIEFVELSAK